MFAIRTKRLVLRDIVKTDFESMHALRSNPKVTRYMEYIQSGTEAETHAWVTGTMHHNALTPRESYNLTLVRQADHAILGWIGIGKPDEEDVGDLDFGYALLPEHWGQGYATEALAALIDFAFEHLGVHKIYGECDVENVASARVMEKAGLSRLGATDEDIQFIVER